MTTANKKPRAVAGKDVPAEHPMVVAAMIESFSSSARFLPVHPAVKRPLIKGWPLRATSDFGQLRKWWLEHPAAILGVTTGADFGLLGLDVDFRHGGKKSLEALEAKYGKLPATCSFKTPGGVRLIFAGCRDFVSGPSRASSGPASTFAAAAPTGDLRA